MEGTDDFSGETMQSAYLVKNPMMQEEATVLWVNNHVISACPFDGPNNKEFEFRNQISVMFWHVFHCSVYSLSFNREGELPFVPVPYTLGQKEIPLVFGGKNDFASPYADPNKKKFTRALDWLMENVFDVSPHFYGDNGQCRGYRIKEGIFECMFEVRPRTVRDLLMRIRYCKPHYTRENLFGKTIEELCIKRSKNTLKIPVHDLSSFNRNTSREAIKRYRQILDRLTPNTISLRPILKEIAKYSHYSKRSVRYRVIAMQSNLLTFLSRDFQLVEKERLIIRYYPVYRAAGLGGRLFEEMGGFQNLSRSLKQQSHCVGHNVDIQSSQLNILKMEFARNKIPCRILNEMRSVSDFADMFNLPKDVIKICFYGMMFSIGKSMTASAVSNSQAIKAIKKSIHASCRKKAFKQFDGTVIPYRELNEITKKIVDAECEKIRVRWVEETQSIVSGLEALCEKYISSARKCGEGFVLTNCVGARYSWTEVTTDVRKKILSHMITGIETDILFTAIEENNVKEVYSFEHDGALLSRARLASDRIKFVKKPFDSNSKQLVTNL